MQKRVKQAAVVALSLLATFGLLLGVVTLARLFAVNRPLAQVLRRDPEVARFRVLSGSQGPVLQVVLRRVPDLYAAYQSLWQRVGAYLPGPQSLVVEGEPDARLQRVYEGMSFALQEGLSTGYFVTMKRRVDALAHRAGVRDWLFVDAQNVYLALYGARHYLFAVLPRPGTLGGVAAS